MAEPRIALVTTTINVPDVLALYRACDENVRFFVAGDAKTPQVAADFVNELSNARYISVEDQQRWEIAKHIPLNVIQRRNFATLEALEWGADVVVFVDDDNLPIGLDYFDHYAAKLTSPFSGVCVHGFNDWFDPGALLVPHTPHRGFPHQVTSLWGAKSVVNIRTGACAGLCLGDPDISATTRIANAPIVQSVTELGREGVVVDPFTHIVFNTQNSAVAREFVPAMLLVPQWKRYDDILASLICQRVMREFDAHVHLGKPFVYQQRNPHNLVRDLRDEVWGMEMLPHIASMLDELGVPKGKTPLGVAGAVYQTLAADSLVLDSSDLVEAWLRDVEKVL